MIRIHPPSLLGFSSDVNSELISNKNLWSQCHLAQKKLFRTNVGHSWRINFLPFNRMYRNSDMTCFKRNILFENWCNHYHLDYKNHFFTEETKCRTSRLKWGTEGLVQLLHNNTFSFVNVCGTRATFQQQKLRMFSFFHRFCASFLVVFCFF